MTEIREAIENHSYAEYKARKLEDCKLVITKISRIRNGGARQHQQSRILDRLRDPDLCVMYFIAIRPQQKEKKKMQELMASIAVGDSVLTSSGFYGVIIDMTDDTVIVEFGSNKTTAAFPCRSRPSSRLRSRRRKAEREPDTEKVVRLFSVWCGHLGRSVPAWYKKYAGENHCLIKR